MRSVRRLVAAGGGLLVIAGVVAVGVAVDPGRSGRPTGAPAGRTPGSRPAAVVTTSAPSAAATTTTTTTTTTTATTVAPTRPAPTAPADLHLAPGATGPEVLALETRLDALGYWVGALDDRYDRNTAHAVTAFQKVHDLARDGIVGPQTSAALATATRPPARSADGARIEIDLAHQVLALVTDGRVDAMFDVSTGKPSTPTATGRFRIDREIDGYHRSNLGVLYRPKYFHGGQALHGYPNVPPTAASHGCVRLTNDAMDLLWSSGRAPVGTEVWVYR